MLKVNEEGILLKIYISNTDKFKHRPLYEIIVFAAKRYGITGVTVLKGIMGFGMSGKIYSGKFWEITEKIPLVIDIIDTPEKIDFFIEQISPYFETSTLSDRMFEDMSATRGIFPVSGTHV